MSIEEALRLSHCANPERGHKCMGTCIIKPDGVMELKCTLCGDDRQSPKRSYDRPTQDFVREVLRAAGLDWGNLSAETQQNVLDAATKVRCPGCGVFNVPRSSYQQCQCGEWYWDFNAWRRK